jgi:hypothetical protein
MGSVSSWSEGIILSLVFLAVLTLIVLQFNVLYGQVNSLPFSDNSASEQLFINYQDTAQQKIQGGEVAFDANQGITLKSSWGLAKDAVSITWSFLSGGWIEQTVKAWDLGESGTALARGLRILYFISLVFAVLYALFKISF